MSSDEASSEVTYTSVYTDSESWRFQWVSNEEPEVYVPEPKYPEYLVPSDVEAPIEDQPLPMVASPTTPSLGYVADFDPEEDSEEEYADYPTDGGDDDDDYSFDDDNDTNDDVPSVGDTEAFETDESAPTPPPLPAYRVTARMSVRPQAPMPFPSEPGLGANRTTDYGFVDMVDDAPRRHVPREVGYGITDTWDELVDSIQEGAPTTLEGVNARVTELAETYERD
ncbi:hypothetical protein Tco_0468955 [Tanacetum coccineum]